MGDNIIHITDAGLQAANNAAAGGVLVNVTSFKIGDSDADHNDTHFNIQGNLIYGGPIHYIETTSSSSVRFTFEVPASAIPDGGITGREVSLFMQDGTMFGRCVFGEPYNLRDSNATRIHAYLITTRCDISVINITSGDLVSIPSTTSLDRLPTPDSSDYNTIEVLNMNDNVDGTETAGIALKMSNQWAFSGYERVFVGAPTEVTGDCIKQSALTTSLTFRNGERVILYVTAGSARGQARKYYYELSTECFKLAPGYDAFSSMDTGNTLAIWRRLTGTGGAANDYPPQMATIPPDWVLTRGVSNLPVWAPPKNTGKNVNTLYVSPGRLRISTINEVGTGQQNRYSLGGVLPRDVNHVMTALGGVTQHKSAFDISSSEIEYSENIPPHAPIDVRLLVKEPGTGTYIDIVTHDFVGDGETKRFPLTVVPESAEYCFSYIRGLLQSTTSYTLDTGTNELVFVAAPAEGIAIETGVVVARQEEGYSTTVTSTTVITIGDTLYIELPVEPQSKDLTFLSVSGTHIHRNLYTIVDNRIVLSSPVKGGLDIETTILNNVLSEGTPQTNLKGMVVDAVLTSKALKLFRHDAYPVVLPIPAINMTAGPGIKITGQHPDYKVENTFAQQFTTQTNFKFSTLRRQPDSEEIVYTYRVDLVGDLMLQVSCDFSAMLGPGFESVDGLEVIEYVMGFRTTSAKEPEYGRDIKGTGTAGFSSLAGGANEKAFANASMTQVFDVIHANIPAGYIDVVAKMRVRHANISKYGSKLAMNFNVIGTPRLS